ncbi:MAG: ABC transporter ATP-binding protein [Myxococcota bacterium]
MTAGVRQPGAPVLSLSGVGVSYWKRTGLFRRGRFWALQDVSFDVGHGETLGIIGRNGAGKSTLLRLLARVIEPDRGELRSEQITASLLSLKLGFVPTLTGRENAQLSGMLQGLRRAEIAARMDEIVEFSDLQEFIDQPIATYSSGMLARLAFAVAFQSKPDVLLIDEVWGVGDADFRQKSRLVMREMVSSQRTVVLVTHNLDLVRRFCDRAVWIEGGTSRAVGPPEEVIESYLGAAGQE